MNSVVRFAADETMVLLAAAKEALGIAALPGRLCEAEIASGALRRVLPDWIAGGVPLRAAEGRF